MASGSRQLWSGGGQPNPGLMFVDFMLRATGENLLLAPVRHGTECVAADEILKSLLIGPFAGDEIRGTVADVFPQRRTGVTFCRFQRADDRAELFFEVLLLAFDNVIVHSDGDHFELSPLHASLDIWADSPAVLILPIGTDLVSSTEIRL